MPAIRMLALVTDAFGGRGGIAQYNRDFLGSLVQGEAVASVVIVPRMAPGPAAPPARITQVRPRLGRIGYMLTALRVALGAHFDVVFCGHLYMAPLAWLIARLCGARLVVQMHGIEAWPRPSRWRRAVVEAGDLFLCVSRYTRARFLGWASVPPERVIVLPNTVNPAFSPAGESALRTAWSLEGKTVLLTVGRMDARERYKGHDKVISALQMLDKNVVYVVLGEGNDLTRLESLARETGVADRVRFVGAQNAEALVAAYRMADLFVMPSTGEGFGIAFLEAMACGTPALGLGVAGARDALADGALGIMVEETDFESALAAALQRPKPDAHTLHAAVLIRFGAATFTAGTRAVLNRLEAS